MDAMVAIMGIVFGVGSPVLVIYLILYFSNLRTAKRMDTLIKMVDKGVTVDPEMLEMLNEPSGPRADMRKGMVWLAVGIPLTLGIMFQEGGSAWIFGLIPVFIGIAYLLAMKFELDKEKEEEAKQSQLG